MEASQQTIIQDPAAVSSQASCTPPHQEGLIGIARLSICAFIRWTHPSRVKHLTSLMWLEEM